MSHRFFRCPHCKLPHDATEQACPNTGRPLLDEHRRAAQEARREGARSRVGALPPPKRQPAAPGEGARRDRVPGIRAAAAPHTTVFVEDDQRALLGQTVGGRYTIKGILGEGGMGTVYDGEHIGLGRPVAIKVLSPAQAKKGVAVKRFQQEARAAGGIGHPNICEIYDMGLLENGSPYLVMEKLTGQTLADRISKEGGLPFEDVIDVVGQVLSGLVAAHDKGIVHRDIKPENIFLARRLGSAPIVKLLDFGVSKMMPEFLGGEDALDLTRTGMVMGTPYYMSPEQARGERNLDGRVDVYACGVVMYEAIAGRRPFLAANYNALLLAIISTKPRSLREIRPTTPPALEAIIQRAMARSRDDRYPNAKAFLRDLTPPAPEAAPGRVPRPPSAEERRRAPVLGGGRARPSPERQPFRAALPAPPLDRGEAGAVLQSRSADARRPTNEDATRLDIKVPSKPADAVRPPGAQLPSLSGSTPDEDGSLAMPIHILADKPVDDDLTEVFEPRASAEVSAMPPATHRVSDDWDCETVVKLPEFESSAELPAHPAPPPPRTELDFDETMALDDSHDIVILRDALDPSRRR